MQKGKVYSPIHSLRIENFMAIKDSTITFTDNFVNLKGMNSRGKSATNKAFRVLMTNYKANKQKKWIKWGEDYFRLSLVLENGIVIIYEKRKNGKALYEIYDERDTLLFSTFKDGVYAPIVEVPEPVQNLIGITKKGSISPNFMKSREPLFIVDTTGKTNDEYLRGTLEPEDVTKAQELVKEDIASKRAGLSETISAVNGFKSILDESPLIDERVVDYLKESDNKLNNVLVVSDSLTEASDLNLRYKTLTPLPEIELLNEKDLAILNLINGSEEKFRLYNSIQPLPDVDSIEQHDLLSLDALRVISNLTQNYQQLKPLPDVELTDSNIFISIQMIDKLEQMYKDYANATIYPDVELLNTDLLNSIDVFSKVETLHKLQSQMVIPELSTIPLQSIQSVLASIESYTNIQHECNQLEQDTKQSTESIELFSKELLNQNLIVGTCDDCGHLYILDRDGNDLSPQHKQGVLA